MTAVAFLGCWLAAGQQSAALAVVYCIFLAGLIVATFIDFEHFIIPDEITIGGMLAGLLLSVLVPQLHQQLPAVPPSASHGESVPAFEAAPQAPASDPSLPIPGLSRLTSLKQSLIGLAFGAGLIYAILRAGKLFFGRQKIELPPEARIIFTETALLLPDKQVAYEDLFYRKTDTVALHARTLELIDRCYKDVVVRLSPGGLQIGEERLDPEQVPHMEAVSGEIVLPREAMGFGDVKFMGAIGAFLGWQAVLFSLMISSLIGSIVGVTLILLRKQAWSARLPYGPYIALAAMIWIFGGHRLVDWWFGR